MKTLLLLITLTLSLISSSSFAHTEEEMDPRSKVVFQAIKKMAKECLVKDDSALLMKSTCDSIIIDTNSSARIRVDGHWFNAIVATSDEADGGDLDDLYLFDENNRFFGEIMEIASFGHIGLALLGGENLEMNP